MNRILLILDQRENRRLLAEWLANRYEVIAFDPEKGLDSCFDLCILDGPALSRLWKQVQARKEAEQPLFLPFLLVTSRQDIGLATRYLWRSIDELILAPVEKVELQARVEILLRTRRQSSSLKEINAELNSFSYSVSHDLRAPLRGMQGLSRALSADYADRLDPTGRKYLHLIAEAAEQMDTLIQDLLAYSRVSRTEIEIRPVRLEVVVEEVSRQLESEIREKSIQLTVDKPFPEVMGHYGILVQVVTNLLTNAMKFLAPEVEPQVRIWAETGGQCCIADGARLWVEDNGIGIAPEHHERIFSVFERLHGNESYPGTGIGLAIVRKGMERMGGRTGVESEIGKGSRFWIELPQAKAKT